MKIARELGIHLHFPDNLNDLLGMYTYRHKERHILLNSNMEYLIMQMVCGHEIGHDSTSRPEIAVKRDNMKDYDTIFVGFLIWWYVAPTIINTFLESYDLTGKTIIPFATSGGSGIGKTNERLAPSCKGAKLMDGKVFKGSVGHQELAAWVDGLGL